MPWNPSSRTRSARQRRVSPRFPLARAVLRARMPVAALAGTGMAGSAQAAGRDPALLCRMVAALVAPPQARDLLRPAAEPGDVTRGAARRRAMYLAHVVLGLPLAEVARGFGGDPAAVARACRAVEAARTRGGGDAELAAIAHVLRWVAGR